MSTRVSNESEYSAGSKRCQSRPVLNPCYQNLRISSCLLVTRERWPRMSPNLSIFAQHCSEEELRVIGEGSFVPQSDHGIDAHGAARGQISSNQTDRGHYRSGNDNRKRTGDWQLGDQAGGYAFSP